MPPSPPPVAHKEPIYDISRLPLDPVERQHIANYPINDQVQFDDQILLKAHSNLMHMNLKVEKLVIGIGNSFHMVL